MKHSKGPWFVKENGGKGELVGVASGSSSWFVAEEVLAADAHLIAAAPDLLEALENIKVEFGRLKECSPNLRDVVYLNGVLAVVDSMSSKAIAKAKGE